jgi:hypothetical protein
MQGFAIARRAPLGAGLAVTAAAVQAQGVIR